MQPPILITNVGSYKTNVTKNDFEGKLSESEIYSRYRATALDIMRRNPDPSSSDKRDFLNFFLVATGKDIHDVSSDLNLSWKVTNDIFSNHNYSIRFFHWIKLRVYFLGLLTS